ncbi:MAG: phosphatidylcholine synthase [Proteobacteria bacterium]|nr:phosphatidylcholine synthase [Pseudomonadota bacterium]
MKRDDEPLAAARPGERLRGFGVHLLTASGGAVAILALFAAVEQRWPVMFLWLGAALAIDALDGPLARRWRVAAALPRWSGETLDLIVDFLTYVFVPAYAIAAAGVLPAALAAPGAVAIVVSGALYFADRRMKTHDNYFRGFPALWNVVAFYLLLLAPAPAVAAATVAILVALTFAPVPFIHPFRVRRLRFATLALLVAWAALAFVAVLDGLVADAWTKAGLCLIGAYFLAAGILRRPRGGGELPDA